MEQQQAKVLVAYLCAAFRPRDFGSASESLYVGALVEFQPDAARSACEWIVNRGFTRMPSVAEVREECRDRRDTASPSLLHPEPPALPEGVGLAEMPPALVERVEHLLSVPDPEGRTLEELLADVAAVQEIEKRWGPGGVPQGEYDPIQATDGPPCPMGDGPTVHNGGALWFCRNCG